MPKCDFNKVAFRTPFLKNTSGRLLLIFGTESSDLNFDGFFVFIC